jgi:hypothetical protein
MNKEDGKNAKFAKNLCTSIFNICLFESGNLYGSATLQRSIIDSDGKHDNPRVSCSLNIDKNTSNLFRKQLLPMGFLSYQSEVQMMCDEGELECAEERPRV